MWRCRVEGVELKVMATIEFKNLNIFTKGLREKDVDIEMLDTLDHGLRPGGPWFSTWSPGPEWKPPHSVWPLGLDRWVEGFRATLTWPHPAGPRQTDL